MNEQELNKMMAEWTEWEQIINSPFGYIGLDPLDKNRNPRIKVEVPNFIESLDACFERLVPKLQEMNKTISLIAMSKRNVYKDARGKEGKFFYAKIGKIMASAHNPALAICLVVEKLIDSQLCTEK